MTHLRRPAALAATIALLGSGVLAPATPAQAEVEGRTRGYDLRCSARVDGQPVQVAVHDVDRGASYSLVKIGRGDRQVVFYSDRGRVVTQRQVLVHGGSADEPMTVIGSVRRSGDPQRAATRTQDGLGTYVTRGTRTPVRTGLEIRWQGERAPLTCRWASAFDTWTSAE